MAAGRIFDVKVIYLDVHEHDCVYVSYIVATWHMYIE